MINLSSRNTTFELMDTEDVDYDDFAQCLDHLSVINTLTRAYRPTLKWIDKIKPFSVLDVGSGGGDMLRKVWHRLKHRHHTIALTGADMNPYSQKYAEARTRENVPLSFMTENAFNLKFDKKPDAIICSLFAHHLSDEELVSFLKWMDQTCTKGWFINDLHRHFIPYYFIKNITNILPVHRFVKHDAAVSVARSFKKRDWIRLLKEADINLDRCDISWHFPFRYCVSCQK